MGSVGTSDREPEDLRMNDEIGITFMRHGRSRADDEEVIEGRYDSPLTEVGREQAVRRGEELKKRGIEFDAIIASTLVRASETARIVGEILGIEVEPDADWMEKDYGPLGACRLQTHREHIPRRTSTIHSSRTL
ncbi:MAG: hypothetical protein CME26_15210 [Gemmatimonadetes bacterium]|nr:hypothetical protein [Gemmatimonadota bacterium]